MFHLLLTRNALQRYGLLVLSHALPYLCAFSSVISLYLYISCLILSCVMRTPMTQGGSHSAILYISASPPCLHRRESSETILLFIDSGGSEVGLVKLEFKGLFKDRASVF